MKLSAKLKNFYTANSELPQLFDFLKKALNALYRIVLNFADSFILAF